MKKLIPALSLLLVTAILMASSTYAWFTMNTAVTASGLSVKATAGGNLLIYSGDSPAVANFMPSWDFKMGTEGGPEIKEMAPTSTADLSTWYKATAAAVNASAKTGDYGEDTDTNHLTQKFYLYAGEDMNVYVSALTINKELTNNPLWNSLRLGIKIGSNFCIYALSAKTADGSPYNAPTGTDATAVAVAKVSETATKTVLNGEDGTGKVFHSITTDSTATDKDYTCGSIEAEKITEAYAYIWFEGEDGACFTQNFDASTLNISFTISQAPATTETTTSANT